jgi:hypothetical protein
MLQQAKPKWREPIQAILQRDPDSLMKLDHNNRFLIEERMKSPPTPFVIIAKQLNLPVKRARVLEWTAFYALRAGSPKP